MRLVLSFIACLLGVLPALAVGDSGSEAGTQEFAGRVPRVTRPSSHHKKEHSFITEELRTLDNLAKDWRKWDHASGDWGEIRPWLLLRGILPEIVYTSELFTNAEGGITTRRTPKVLGNLGLSLTFDTERLGLWPGGTLFLYGETQDGDGNGINDRVGSPLNSVSSLNASDFTQMSAYYLVKIYSVAS